METEKEPVRPIIDQLSEYAETRFKLLKYEVIERSTALIADLVVQLVIVMSLLLTFLFASFTLALFLGSLLHSYWQGFGCVAIIYLVIAVIIMINRKGFQKPIINALVRKLFN